MAKPVKIARCFICRFKLEVFHDNYPVVIFRCTNKGCGFHWVGYQPMWANPINVKSPIPTKQARLPVEKKKVRKLHDDLVPLNTFTRSDSS